MEMFWAFLTVVLKNVLLNSENMYSPDLLVKLWVFVE